MPKSKDAENLDKHLATQIRAQRARLGITARKLDEALGVLPGTMSRIERGVKRLDSETMLRFSAYLDIPMEAFFVGAPTPVVAPDPAAQSPVPVAEVDAFIGLYKAIPNKETRHELLGLVRSVADSPLYTESG